MPQRFLETWATHPGQIRTDEGLPKGQLGRGSGTRGETGGSAAVFIGRHILGRGTDES